MNLKAIESKHYTIYPLKRNWIYDGMYILLCIWQILNDRYLINLLDRITNANDKKLASHILNLYSLRKDNEMEIEDESNKISRSLMSKYISSDCSTDLIYFLWF